MQVASLGILYLIKKGVVVMKKLLSSLLAIVIVAFIVFIFVYTFTNKTEVTGDNISATLKNNMNQSIEIDGETAYKLYEFTSGFKRKSKKSNVSFNEIDFYVDGSYLYTVEFSDPFDTEKSKSIIEKDDEYYKVVF